ncbi:MAG TPA: sensor domain-containing diguanylate cyclase [Burkholderiales bacterium]|nr:sensor domain-containing diguanylate cyclase [Burkholderiales bacterium]
MRRRVRAPLPASLVEHWPDAVLLADAHGVIEYVNPAFERLTGYRASEALGRTPALLQSGSHDARFYRRLWSQLRRGRTFRGVFLNRRKNGELFHEEETIRPLRGPDGRIARFICAGRDVSALMRELQLLKRLATHDALTGLPNRALFADRLAQALRQGERRREAVVVAMLDLDDFKRINTHYGHLAGDAVLRSVARRTLRCLRSIDTVARVGGDEFALVLPAVGSRAAAARVLEKIRAANAVTLRYGRTRIPVVVSIGASLFPRHAKSEMALRKRADAAMYAAKKAGGNRWKFAR